MKLIEDNSGFVHFPIPGKIIDRIDGVKTFIYLVAFDPIDMSNVAYTLSNLKLNLQGTLVSDDISVRKRHFQQGATLDEMVENQLEINDFETRYFPNQIEETQQSIPLTSAICIGWNENSFEFKDGSQWVCTFRDLTHEGQKLYYSIKKLHNNKEVRILTFNNI
jgi:hypothetical protein